MSKLLKMAGGSLLVWCVTAMPLFAQSYETAPNDALNVKIATLSNGMKVYMSVYKDAPRVQTMIATRAGSKNDPETATGLAHYLEHMLFKGNSHFGTKDWAKEKVQLQIISDLYEKRRGVTDPAARKALYHQIDSVSQVAAGLAIANEYDKMMASIGAQGTNAFTWVDQTVYVEDVPTNGLEKWAMVESDRFQELTLRLFHTELEAVYEEYNIGQGYDSERVYEALLKGLFPTHTYGTQSTIGTSEHLKNPSMVKIYQFFDTYYVPNNMAIIMSGDFDPDKTVAMLEKYFGSWKARPVPKWEVKPQAPITKPVEREVFGNEAASLTMGYRFGGANSDDVLKLLLIKGILSNGQAGLLDLDLLQQQKVLSITASPLVMHDYSAFLIEAKPREGQTPEQVRDLAVAELNKIAKGDFEEWLIPAAIKYLKLQDIKSNETNRGRASTMLDAFIGEQKWADAASKYARMEKITKKDLMAFAKQNFGNNYVAIYKRVGEAKDIVKVDKPAITPVPLNKVDNSEFKQKYDATPMAALEPKFIDFKKDLQSQKLPSGVQFDYIKNPENATFQLYYSFDMGKRHDKELPIAIKLLPYLGTNKYSAKQLQQEFFKLGVTLDVYAGEDRMYVQLSGLEESLAKGTELFEHLLANAKPDQKALAGVVADVQKEREDAAKDKDQLRNALFSYGQYGKFSPQTNILSADELKALKVDKLVTKIKGLSDYTHKVFYYGAMPADDAALVVGKYHTTKGAKPIPAAPEYTEQPTEQTQVFVVNSTDMPQAEVGFLTRGDKFDPKTEADAALYNEYFGGDMSSIIFQEIRESRALAYSTWAWYTTPRYADRNHYMRSYVGTQADKLKDAANGVMDLVQNMPVDKKRIETAKAAFLKRMENERITKADIYWKIYSAKQLGYDHDNRADIYNRVKEMTAEDVANFQQKNIKGKGMNVLVVGDLKKLDMAYLKTLGNVTILSIKDVMGYEAHP
jgi:zinc protease